jgi:uncharacterized repeat protein (TIGR04052 family)
MRLLALLPVLAFVTASACDDPESDRIDAATTDAGNSPEAGPAVTLLADGPVRQAVTIQFVPRVGGLPFSCASTYPGLGSDGSDVKPGDFRFYVQDARLIDEQGREVPIAFDPDGRWQQASVALLDFEDKQDECANGTEQTNDKVIGSVPAGRYRGLRFSLGVPFELNHRPLTGSKPPLDLTALFWSWNSGHLFVKAEASALVTSAVVEADAGVADAGSDAPAGPRRNTFVLHLGSTLCEGKATEGALIECKHPNRAAVELPDFRPGLSRVIVDFAEIFKESALQASPGCHSFAGGETCVAPFDRVGVDWVTGRPTPGTQKVFRLE